MTNFAQPSGKRLASRARASIAARLENQFSAFRKRWHRLALPLLLPENPPAQSQKWAVFAFNTVSPARIASVTMMMRGLMRRGWHVKYVYAGHGFDELFDPDREISGGLQALQWHFSRLVSASPSPAEWTLDLKNGHAIAAGYDYFKLFENTLSAYARRYQLSLDDPDHAELVNSIIETAKAALEIALRIETAALSGKRVVLITEEAHAVGNGTLHEFFTHPSRKDLIDIYLQQEAYSNYVNGVLYDRNILLTKSDIPDAYTAYYVTRNEFLPWYKQLSEASHASIASLVEPLLQPSYSRAPRAFHPKERSLKKIEATRNKGRPVYCLFAHVLFDRAKFDAAGPFDNMVDWVRKTIEIFRDIDGLLLLKPHPWELGSLQFKPKEQLVDIVRDSSIPDNVVLLEPDEFDSRQLMQLIDGAILWQSTALLEMTIAGTPCAYCGPPCYYTEPLELSAPKTMRSYADILQHLPERLVTDNEKRRAMAVLYLLNIARVVPVDLIRHIPFSIAETRVVSPLQFLKALMNRETYSDHLAETIEYRRPSAIGPLADNRIITHKPNEGTVTPVNQVRRTRVAS